MILNEVASATIYVRTGCLCTGSLVSHALPLPPCKFIVSFTAIAITAPATAIRKMILRCQMRSLLWERTTEGDHTSNINI